MGRKNLQMCEKKYFTDFYWKGFCLTRLFATKWSEQKT